MSLTQRDKSVVINILDEVLGVGTSLKGDEQAHHCPFCHHHKKKLQINLNTQKWHCWVCDAKGKKIQTLLKRLHVDSKRIKKVYEIYGDDYIVSKTTDEEKVELRLPSEFKSLLTKPKGLNPLYKKVVQYAKDRGITKEDIIRYNIGYCDSGIYTNRIIIPSYDVDGRLNYFIARSVYVEEKFKYKNPPVSKNVTIFENQINWKQPITLCEGVFDAMSIKRNAIPLLGKFIPKTLMDNIYKKGVKEIKILLDKDAQDQALYYVNYFMNNGITVTNILPTEKDAGDMGFTEVNKMLKQTKKSGFEDIVTQKLMGI
jgi:DNA primase|tara:strand:+ start:500 stop:1441 length:942 start_codon:yes stop_codon:yes gene_type:complete